MTKEDLNPAEGKQYGNEFLFNHRMAIIFSRIATISPFILFPFLSFYFQNWWLLFGILIANIGGMLSINRIWIILSIIILITYTLIYGFIWNNYVNVYFSHYLFGHITFYFSNYYQKKLEKTKSDIDYQVGKQLNGRFDEK